MELEWAGIPTVCIVHQEMRDSARAIARISGHPDYPMIVVDYPSIPTATWTDDEPSYRLYPGDDIDVIVPSAPELNKTVTVQPDGRIMLPLLDPQMAADKTAGELEQSLAAAYASQLLRPDVEVVVKAQPLKVFVGGGSEKISTDRVAKALNWVLSNAENYRKKYGVLISAVNLSLGSYENISDGAALNTLEKSEEVDLIKKLR